MLGCRTALALMVYFARGSMDMVREFLLALHTCNRVCYACIIQPKALQDCLLSVYRDQQLEIVLIWCALALALPEALQSAILDTRDNIGCSVGCPSSLEAAVSFSVGAKLSMDRLGAERAGTALRMKVQSGEALSDAQVRLYAAY